MAYIPSLPGGDKSPLSDDDKTVVHGAYGCGYSTAGEVAKSIMREKRHGSRMRIASGGWTQEADADWQYVDFGSVDWDYGNMASLGESGDHKFLFPESGYYWAAATLEYSGSTSGIRQLRLVVNQATQHEVLALRQTGYQTSACNASDDRSIILCGSTIFRITTSMLPESNLKVQSYQDSGASLLILSGHAVVWRMWKE